MVNNSLIFCIVFRTIKKLFHVNFSKIFFIVILFVLSSLKAQNISVSASTDTTDYKVGDYIKYQLELKYDKNIKVFLPSIKDSIKNLEFIQVLKPEKSEVDNKIIERHTYIFSKYDSSSVTIPSYKIYYQLPKDTAKQFLAVNPVTITVKTLQVELQKDIRDVKKPIKVPINLLLIALIILLIILLSVGGYYLYRYYKKKKESKISEEVEIKIPPHEIALNELRILEEKKLWQQGLVKEYHSEITEIIRKYFEGRFNFRALEMTSSEILACLSYLEEGKNIVNLANDFFNNADMVKFAKFQPMPSVNEEMMKQAYKIVNETIPKAVEVNAEEVTDAK